MKTLAAVALATLLAPSAFSQVVQAWPSSLPVGTTSDAAGGNFATSHRQSVAVIRRAVGSPPGPSEVHFLYEPVGLSAFSVLPVPIVEPRSVATLSRHGNDRLLVSGDGPPVVCRRDAGATEFTYDVLDLPLWAGARSLRVRPSTGDRFLIAATTSSGDLLTAEIDSETGAVLSEYSISAAGLSVLDYDWSDWGEDAQGDVELAIVATDGLYVVSAAGALVDYQFFSCVSASVRAVRHDNGLAVVERLAILFHDGDWKLTTVNATVLDAPGVLNAGGLLRGVADARLSVADFDLDGDDDLHVWQGASPHGLTLDNQADAGAIWFPNPVTPDFYAYSAAPGAQVYNTANSVCHDFDGNGYPDVFTCVGSSQEVYVQLDLSGVLQVVLPRSYGDSMVASANYVFGGGAATVKLSLDNIEGATHHRVTAWHQANPTLQAETPLSLEAFHSRVIDVSVAGVGTTTEAIDVASITDLQSLFGVWPNNDHLWIEIQAIDQSTDRLLAVEVVAVNLAAEDPYPVLLPSPVPEVPYPYGPYLQSKEDESTRTVNLPDRPVWVGVVLIRPIEPPPFDDVGIPKEDG